jgi:hypothetical protein
MNRQRKLMAVLAVGVVLGGAGSALAVEYIVEQWRMTEITLTSTTAYTNPIMDASITADFSGPEGTVISRPGFWDGGNTWKIRFAPTKVGAWTYTVTASDTSNAGLHNRTGTVTATAYSGSLDIYKHGFIGISADTRYFTHADGTPFFYLGDTHWSMPAEPFDTSSAPGIPSQFKHIVDKRVSQGFTVYQSEPLKPLNAGYNLRDGLSESDLAEFANFDRRFDYIAAKGMVHANAQLFFPTELYNLSYYPDGYLMNLCRYWVARYGAYPVMWTTAQEVDNDFYYGSTGNTYWDAANNPWKKVAAWVHEFDSYAHPLSAHMENTYHTKASNSSFKNIAGHNWYAAQWAPGKSTQLDFTVPKNFWNDSVRKPTVNYEGCYDHLWTKEFGARAQGWNAYLNGMYGHGYGAIDMWLYDSDYDTNTSTVRDGDTITVADKLIKWDVSIEFPAGYQMGYMRSFLGNLEWWKLVPRFDDSTWYQNDAAFYSVASDSNKVYVAYFYKASLATGTLKNLIDGAQYTAQWYNPRANQYGSPTTFTASSSRTIGNKPDNNDWVLLVRLTSSIPLYPVSYNANGATSGSAPADQTKTNAVALTLATNSGNLTKTGFIFDGWNTAADGSGTSYSEGATYTAHVAATLYAKWSAMAPELDVTRSGTAVADGGTDSVTGTVAGVATSLTYTLTNSGSAALTITGATTVVNQRNCTATVITQPTGSVAAGGSTSVVVSVTPTAAGTGSFTLSTPNNDADENPYDWTVVFSWATGGTVTNYTDAGGTNWTAHIFTAVGTDGFVVTAGGPVEYLVVGGGGGGGSAVYSGAGGGGGGGVKTTGPGSELWLAAGTYTITVGAGGGGGTNTGTAGMNGFNGGDSSITNAGGSVSVIAKGGGGGGGNYSNNGSSGASGGGGAYTGLPGTNNAPGQGKDGGAGYSTSGDGNSAGGGGGGYSGVGQAATLTKGGDGGVGVTNSLTGYARPYAGGGGGGKRSSTAVGYGKDGGGNGVKGAPTAGRVNSGGGGGGNGTAGATPLNGAAGGSGIVIVRYVTGGAQPSAPAITAQPAHATVTAGSTAMFSVTASGTAPLAYQWYKTNAVIGGATASSYTTPATTLADNNAQFQVTVTNAYGAVTSSVATLTVNAAPTGTVVATGGMVTNYTLNGTNFTAHIFTTVGTTNLNVTIGGNIEVLVVAGGGGGGKNGGGGGAGGLVYSNGFPLVAGTYSVSVGGGGAASTGGSGGNGTNSVFSNSVFSAIVAMGGGGGAGLGNIGLNGGSGGGGGGVTNVPTRSGGTNTVGQGYMGGSGGVLSGTWGGNGGGGGAGSAGLPGDNSSNGGNGGRGVYVSAFTGVVASTVGTTDDGWFAGGGGGAEVTGTAGAGGRGGGGRSNIDLPGTAGSPNTGGGGGGGCWTGSSNNEGGAGGSGIVIVRYVTGGGVAPFEAWRQTYFTAEQLTNADVSGAIADPDHDGLNNEQEYLAGTNPTNALSCLVISAATNNPATSGTFVLSWQSVLNKMYKVMAATNLMTGFTDLATNIHATPAVNVHTDSVENAGQRFYRIKLE